MNDLFWGWVNGEWQVCKWSLNKICVVNLLSGPDIPKERVIIGPNIAVTPKPDTKPAYQREEKAI